jgi:mRNA interferase MazF
MKRGEVWWTLFDPFMGGEIRKTRPAIIISNDASNKALNRLQVIPLTSQIERIYSSEAYVMIQNKKAKAMADQIRTVSKQRLKTYIVTLLPDEITAVEDAVKLQLGLY